MRFRHKSAPRTAVFVGVLLLQLLLCASQGNSCFVVSLLLKPLNGNNSHCRMAHKSATALDGNMKGIRRTRMTSAEGDREPSSVQDRRRALREFVHIASMTVVVSGGTGLQLAFQSAAAFGTAGTVPSRQLEFCLVSVARAVYWAKLVAQQLQQQDDPSLARAAYLEARLGAKAMLTGKIGSGSNAKVYMLSTLQVPGSLQDLQTYYSQVGRSGDNNKNDNQLFADWKSDWHEAVANIVEFDGLDTLTDPSPRSSLTLQQYDPSKALFVLRILTEKVIPVGQKLLQADFPEEARQRAKDYIERTYSNEVLGESIL